MRISGTFCSNPTVGWLDSSQFLWLLSSLSRTCLLLSTLVHPRTFVILFYKKKGLVLPFMNTMFLSVCREVKYHFGINNNIIDLIYPDAGICSVVTSEGPH